MVAQHLVCLWLLALTNSPVRHVLARTVAHVCAFLLGVYPRVGCWVIYFRAAYLLLCNQPRIVILDTGATLSKSLSSKTSERICLAPSFSYEKADTQAGRATCVKSHGK